MKPSINFSKVEYANIYLLRLSAIFFIVNSHLASIYPSKAFAFGGYLGNSLFFFVSAMGLALSKSCHLSYLLWLKKRFLNLLLPITILVMVVELDLDGALSKLTELLIPHELSQLKSFFPNLVILYLFFWPLNRLSVRQLGVLLVALAVVPYVALYSFPDVVLSFETSLALTFFPFSAWMSFLAGLLVARLLAKGYFECTSFMSTFLWGAGLFFCLYMHYLLGSSSVNSIQLLVIYVNLMAVLFVYSASYVFNLLPKDSVIVKWSKQLSLLSLPVYIIHFEVIHWVAPFKINPFVKVGLIFLVSFILAKGFDLIYACIRKKVNFFLEMKAA